MHARLRPRLFLPGLLVPVAIASAEWPGDPVENLPICTAQGSQRTVFMTRDASQGAIFAWLDQRSGLRDIFAQRADQDGNLLWQANGTPVSTGAGDELFPLFESNDRHPLAADLDGGVFVVFHRFNGAGNQTDIFGQHVTADGAAEWGPDGRLLSGGPGEDLNVSLAGEGMDGLIIVWQSDRASDDGTFDILAQRIDATGQPMWNSDLFVVNAPGSQINPRVVADGAGGAFVVWEDLRNAGGTGVDLYAQHISADGALLWPADGAPVVTAEGDQTQVVLAPDGHGGLLLAWTDARNGPDDQDIYAQRLDEAGQPLWDPDGVPVTQADRSQFLPDIVPMHDGGGIIGWVDRRADDGQPPFEQDIWAQRISPAGLPMWPEDGVPVSAAPGGEDHPNMSGDCRGGAFVVWEQEGDGSGLAGPGTDIFIQWMNSDGTPRFEFGGHPVSIAEQRQARAAVMFDEYQGAIVAWEDSRNAQSTEADVYADRVDIGPAGDIDFDGDVDIVDFSTFMGCFAGSGRRVEMECEIADLNGDGYVDIVDFQTFSSQFTGSR